MDWNVSSVNWLAVLVSVVVGQMISTAWFVALFAKPWAAEYGVATPKEHTQQIPGYTYGVQALCTALMVISVALLQAALGVTTLGEALQLALLLGVGVVIANGLPGQAFLKRWRAAAIALGCQVVMVIAASIILVLWK